MGKNIGVLIGSLRKESITRKIANNLVKMFPDNYNVKILSIDMPLYNQDFDDIGPVPDEIVEYRKSLKDIQGFLIVTPEYNRSIPAGLKNALDVGSRPYGQNLYDNKPTAIVSCGSGSLGGFGANHHLRQTCVFLNMPMMNQPELYLAYMDKLIDDEGNIKDKNTKKFLQSAIDSYVDWIERLD